MEEKNTRSRSWFLVLNNPAEHYPELKSKTPEEMCKCLSDWWCLSENRSGAWVYCVSAEGLHHVHMVLEDKNKASFKQVKSTYPTAHIEPTQGNKKQVEDYIYKRGAFEEKGEKIIYTHIVGEIVGKQGKRTDLEKVKKLVDSGLSVREVLATNPNFYRLERYIERMAYEKRLAETPCIREVSVFWHFGATGTGKTLTAYKHQTEQGRENVFIVSAENEHPFDRYVAQGEVWLDELRAGSPYFTFARMLGVLDCYTSDVSARYSDRLMLWHEIHITSPMLPQELYNGLRHEQDKLKQLLRRIRHYVYHFRDCQGNLQQIDIDTKNDGLQRDRWVFDAEKFNFDKKIKPVSGGTDTDLSDNRHS